MNRSRTRWGARAALAVVALVITAVGASGAMTASSAPSATLVVDRSFEIKTADPQRAFEPTASIVDRGVYDTFFTYNGGDLAHPVPQLVQSWKASKDAKTFTFNLRRNVHFADGTRLTAADAVFSFRRLINLKGNPSFLLDGVTVSSRGKYTVILHSKAPNAALPSILTNTSLAVVNSKLVRKHGGTSAVGADKNDKAEKWFNSAASRGAGSGPYLLQRYSTTSQITMVPNPRYWGAKKANFKTVVIRNMIASTQLINIQRGKHEVAIDLSADQAQTVRGNSRLNVATRPSTWTFWLFANNNPAISSITPNQHFQAAVRYALDYKSIVGVAGPGAIQAPGVIPSMFLGALPRKEAIKTNLTKARSELAASGAGNKTITLEFPSDLTINGVPFTSLAQRVQANLQAAGFHIELAGATVGTWLQKYRDGKMAFGLSLWGPDYPDPLDYLAFMPGELVGVRAGWPAGADPTLDRLAAKARITSKASARQTVYRQIQRRLNAVGPFFPLLQPTQVFVSTKDLKNAVFNAQYQVDVTRVAPK
ncbi:MAG: peptide/nickel transport system substrate-binding protein [Gaiellaceae bacterium]|jgi:peptide/nickel transport system substrate-binding protein|nr:peptide/nickel transport system substrate-binding protein [Gaiellaceae bacterium]MDX6436780.1 peptide/nickel transport system substrate-binding protein [Gaiellaceae bacterium]